MVYKTAGPEVVDRARLMVVHPHLEDHMNFKYCRVTHNFRCKNDKALLVPVPIAPRPELYSFLTWFKYFWKTDTDSCFLQVVQAPNAIRHTGFELFQQLYISERMLFDQINWPSFFKLNFDIIAYDLKFNQKVVKSFFDNILDGASVEESAENSVFGVSSSDGRAWAALLDSWGQLLRQALLHVWKFKHGKTEFGFEEVVAVGARYNGHTGTISMLDKLIDAVHSLRYPRSLMEVRSVLGLFNQFRDFVPGNVLRVQALTQLTRQSPKEPLLAADASEASDDSRSPRRSVTCGPITMTV